MGIKFETLPQKLKTASSSPIEIKTLYMYITYAGYLHTFKNEAK